MSTELPTFLQLMIGCGVPMATQGRVKVTPSCVKYWASGRSVNLGGSETPHNPKPTYSRDSHVFSIIVAFLSCFVNDRLIVLFSLKKPGGSYIPHSQKYHIIPKWHLIWTQCVFLSCFCSRKTFQLLFLFLRKPRGSKIPQNLNQTHSNIF